MEQIATFLEIGMWVIVALLTVIGFFKGRKRGLFRQLVRTATIVASLFIAVAITKFAYGSVTSWVTDNGAEAVVSKLDGFGIALGDFSEIIIKLGADSINHVLAIPMALVILPLVFVISFIIVSVLMRIVHAIICKIFGFARWRNNLLTRLLGMFLGLVTGFMVAVVCLSPIVGLTSTLSDATEKFESTDSYAKSNEDVKKIFEEYIKPLTENSCAKMLAPLGGNMIYDMITTLEVNGESYKIPETVSDSTISVIGAVKSMGGFNFENMDAQSKAALNVLIEVVDKNPYMATMLADVLDAVAQIYTSKEITSDNPMANSIGEILSVFIGLKSDEVAPTLEIVRDSLFIVSMNYDDISDEDKTAFNTLIDSAKKNDYKAATLAKILDAVATDIEARPTVEGDHKGELVRNLFSVFVDIPKNDVVPTLEVIRDALFMLDDEGALAALGQDASLLSEVFSRKDADGNNLVKRLTDKFNSHERTRSLVETTTKLSITVMSETMPKIEGVEITEETYDNVQGTLKDSIVNVNKEYEHVEIVEGTPEYDAYIGAVSGTLSETFVANGINVDKPVADEMAKYIAENHKDKVDEMTDAETNDIILSYYAAYLETQAQQPENP